MDRNQEALDLIERIDAKAVATQQARKWIAPSGKVYFLADGVEVLQAGKQERESGNARAPVIAIRIKLKTGKWKRSTLHDMPADHKAILGCLKDAGDRAAEIRSKIARDVFNFAKEFPTSRIRTGLAGSTGVNTNSVLAPIFADYEAFLDAGGKRRGSCHAYKVNLHAYIKPYWGQKTAGDLTVDNLVEWLKKIRDGEIKGKNRGDRQMGIKGMRNVLVPFNQSIERHIMLCKNQKILEVNPLDQVDLRHLWPSVKEKDNARPFTDEEREKLLAHCVWEELADQYDCTIEMGLRVQEAIALQWREVHLDVKKPYAWICRVNVLDAIEEDTKTKSSEREVPLTPRAIRALKRQFKRTGKKAHGFVWENPRTTKPWLNSGAVCDKAWGTLLRRAGIKHRGPNQMRHTFASNAYRAGIPILVIAKWMGHKDASVTLRKYTRLFAAIDREKGHSFDIPKGFGA